MMMILGISMTSCKFFNMKKNRTETPDQEVVVPVLDPRPIVYACAYDGFVNIRSAPNGNAGIIGKFRNGPQGAVWLGVDGYWTRIDYNGIVGYVLSQYVCGQPTVAVDERISMSWLEGMWDDDPASHTVSYALGNGLLIFDNGKFLRNSTMFMEGAYTEAGTFMLEGSNLVLTILYDYVNEERCNRREVLALDPTRQTIVGYAKVRFLSDSEKINPEDWYGSGMLMMTKKQFRRIKVDLP